MKTGMALSLRVLLVAAAATPAAAQDQYVPRVEVSQPEASFSEPFSNVVGLRELSDGRILVSDRLEVALRLVDFDTGEFRDIGHEGSGPGEYRMPGPLLPLPGDSSLLVDLGNMRMMLVAPDGSLSGSEPMVQPGGFFLMPRGVDERGGLYFDMSNMMQMEPGQGLPDSIAIARFDRASGSIDTICQLPNPAVARMQNLGHGFSFSAAGFAPFGAVDAWGVAVDGRVAIAWGEPYHLEWFSVGGGQVVGPIVEYEPVPVTDADKEAWADRMSSGAVMAVMATGEGHGRTFTPPRPDVDEIDFPEVKAAFPRGAVSVTPEGEVWVRRLVAFREPETYDVFDASGRRVRQVVLPEARTLVGFGAGTLYAARIDEDDLRWLERYRR